MFAAGRYFFFHLSTVNILIFIRVFIFAEKLHSSLLGSKQLYRAATMFSLRDCEPRADSAEYPFTTAGLVVFYFLHFVCVVPIRIVV